jgi:hypothetical protein
MINKSSIKVVLAFTGMILLGLISLVFIDSLKGESNDTSASMNLTK